MLGLLVCAPLSNFILSSQGSRGELSLSEAELGRWQDHLGVSYLEVNLGTQAVADAPVWSGH